MKIGLHRSIKHGQIDKANARTVTVIAIAAALSVFALMASKSMLSQMTYQNRVISAKEAALKQLQSNNAAADELIVSYKEFNGAKESVIGTKDENSKIILDALPSKYDFPALASSMEKILTDGGYKIISISGIDDELKAEQSSATPIPVEVPFQMTASGSYGSMQKLLADLGRSIRPLSVNKLEISGSASDLRLTIDGKSYYQPEKSLEIILKEIK